MSEEEKRYVIVPELATQSYLSHGYERSQQTARERLGEAWHELPPLDRDDLVVLEIAAEQHKQLNQYPQRYRVKLTRDYFVDDAAAQKLELLELGNYASTVASAEHDGGPDYVANGELFLTETEAARAVIPQVRDAIDAHRIAIGQLESFLRVYT